MSLVGYKGKNHRQQVKKNGARDDVDDRSTRPEIFDPLNKFHGFTLDVAASAGNAKCKKFFTREVNGLAQSWAGEVAWCNPPYSNILDWVVKASQETTLNGCQKAVLLLPANRCEQGWWQNYIEPFRDRRIGVETTFLAGRPRFDWPKDRVVPAKGDRPPFGLVVVVFTPREDNIWRKN